MARRKQAGQSLLLLEAERLPFIFLATRFEPRTCGASSNEVVDKTTR